MSGPGPQASRERSGAPAMLPTPDPAPPPRTSGPPYSETVKGAPYELRRLRPEQVGADYVAWMNDPEVIRYLQARFEPRDLDSLRRHVAGYDHVDSFFFGIFDAERDRHIGNITLRVNPHHLFANMGYLIGDRTYQGRDAALEACRLIFDFAFFERGVRKIFECTTENHLASNFNFRRLGFTYEGKIPDLYWGGDGYVAATYWSLKATTWAEVRGRPASEVTP